jgi:hypothetical protein
MKNHDVQQLLSAYGRWVHGVNGQQMKTFMGMAERSEAILWLMTILPIRNRVSQMADMVIVNGTVGLPAPTI